MHTIIYTLYIRTCAAQYFLWIFFRILWWIESSKEQHLFKIKILSNIINDFTVTLQQFIASLLKKSIYKIHLFFLFWWSGWGMSGSSQKYYKNSTYKLCFLESCCCFSARKLSVSCVVSHIFCSLCQIWMCESGRDCRTGTVSLRLLTIPYLPTDWASLAHRIQLNHKHADDWSDFPSNFVSRSITLIALY